MASWSSSQGSPCEGQGSKGGSDPGEEEQNSGVGTSGSQPENPYSQPLAGNKGGQGEGQKRKGGGGMVASEPAPLLPSKPQPWGLGGPRGRQAPLPQACLQLSEVGLWGAELWKTAPRIEPPQRGSLRSVAPSSRPLSSVFPPSLSPRRISSPAPGVPFPHLSSPSLPLSPIPPSSPALSRLPAFPRQISLSLHFFLQLPATLCPQVPLCALSSVPRTRRAWR